MKRLTIPLSDLSQKALAFLAHIVASRLFYYLTICWFALQGVFIAISTKFGIPPDEVYHFYFIKLFAQNGWTPFLHSESGYFFLAEVLHTPFFLYHYLLSLPFHLFSSSAHAYIYLRFINLMLGICAIFIVNRIAGQLKISAFIKNLSIFMLANTLMFVFLSSSVNYDNLFILLSLASLSLLLDLWKELNIVTLLLLLIVLASSLLVKINSIPMDILVAALLCYRLTRQRSLRLLVSKYYKEWAANRLVVSVLTLTLVIFVALVGQRYLGNILTYHNPNPSCTQVHTLAECEQSAIFKRSEDLAAKHPNVQIDPLNYSSQWLTIMRDWTFGILGMLHIYPSHLVRVWSEVLLLLAVIAFIRRYNPRKSTFNAALVIVGSYTLLLLVLNYKGYLHSGLIGLAVQGRYMFALLPLLYLFANYYIFDFLKSHYLRLLYLLFTLGIFLSASLPTYIVLTDASWHTQKTTHINQRLREAALRIYKIVP